MSEKVAFVGIDVDDNAYHVSAVDCAGNPIVSFVTKGSANKLAKDLKKKLASYTINACYEASYVGYSLARVLKKRAIFCAVIAPTSIPRSPNQRIKNDRVDAEKLAEFWRQGSLAVVAIPTEKQESDRAAVRSRSFIVGQISDLKRKILSICREFGIDYKQDVTGATGYWTKAHREWLDKTIKSLDYDMMELSFCLTTLIASLEAQQSFLRGLENRIEELSESETYRGKVQFLRCFKGIQTNTAMTIATEIFDVNRFPHPRKLTAYAGLDVREHSSGGKQNQLGISKMGNRYLRKALVESCQQATRSKTPSKILNARRRGCSQEQIQIAERCRLRLYQKGSRLIARGKHTNKVKVACAREMVGFIWEALRAA